MIAETSALEAANAIGVILGALGVAFIFRWTHRMLCSDTECRDAPFTYDYGPAPLSPDEWALRDFEREAFFFASVIPGARRDRF